MGTYTKSSINRAPRPRSERLRESGATIVSTSTSPMSGAGYIPSGSNHTHANLDALNMITVEDGYIYLTDTYTDETTQEQVTETVKVKAGFADKAAANADGYTLDWFIPVTVNGVLTLKLNPVYAGLWAEGWITAGGIGTGGGGGGGASYLWELDDVSLGTLGSGNLLAWNGTAWTNIDQSTITPDLTGYATQSWANNRFLLKTGGDINGDIFHEIEEAEEGSDEIIVDERWRITENGEATFTSLAVGGVDFSTLNSRVTTLWAARDNYLLKTGGELTGDLWLHTRGLNYGSKLWFGDKGSGDGYVYLHEDTDDHLTIHAADGIKLSTGDGYGILLDNNVTLNSARSFTLGNGVLTWDASANAWKLSGNLYATGFITAGASNPNS